MLQSLVCIFLVYCETFLLRRFLFGDFTAQRPLLILVNEPMTFLRTEIQYLAVSVVIAIVSILLAKSLMNFYPRINKVIYKTNYFLSLSICTSLVVLLSVLIERYVLRVT